MKQAVTGGGRPAMSDIGLRLYSLKVRGLEIIHSQEAQSHEGHQTGTLPGDCRRGLPILEHTPDDNRAGSTHKRTQLSMKSLPNTGPRQENKRVPFYSRHPRITIDKCYRAK